MSSRRIWCCDIIGWIKVSAWVQIIGNLIFIGLLLVAVANVVKNTGQDIGTRSCTNLLDSAGSTIFITLMILIFLGFVGIGMGILLLRGMNEIFESDIYIKAWILYTAVTLIIALVCASVIGYVGVSMLTSIKN